MRINSCNNVNFQAKLEVGRETGQRLGCEGVKKIEQVVKSIGTDESIIRLVTQCDGTLAILSHLLSGLHPDDCIGAFSKEFSKSASADKLGKAIKSVVEADQATNLAGMQAKLAQRGIGKADFKINTIQCTGEHIQ